MRLLIINFEMDPASKVLAWQAAVASELALRCERVVVLTHRATEFPRPSNLDVVVLPTTPQRAPWRWLGGRWWLNIRLWRLCRTHGFDACFIHMNMEWAYRFWPTFALLRLPVLLWYAHGSVTRRLRVAHRCVTRVVTSTPEGFRLASTKVRVIGQGVDTSLFTPQALSADPTDIITVSRIAPRKRLEVQIEALAELAGAAPNVRLRIVGAAITEADRQYERDLRALATARGLEHRVLFEGHVPIDRIPFLYRTAFLHLNVSGTGSMDKTVIEALACGCPVLTSNEAFQDLLAEYPEFRLANTTPRHIADKVLAIHRGRARVDRQALRRMVIGKHDLSSYADKLLRQIEEMAAESVHPAPRPIPSMR